MLRANKSAKGKKNEKSSMCKDERLQIQQRISEFIAGTDVELVIPGLSNEKRKHVHKYIAHMGLISRSTGPKNNRVLHITHRKCYKSLKDVCYLELSSATRSYLKKALPLHETQQSKPSQKQTHKKNPIRSEALLLGLGPRLVPPRAKSISQKLWRDKLELPIYQYEKEIQKNLCQHSIFIISGETGSGKTTQVPQYILQESLHRNQPCRIVVTQPRRVAAVSVSHRVAEERGEQIGDTVGYQIRFESRVQKTTNLIYTTSGCLLRSIMADRKGFFKKITHLIIDEIHERDKFTDFTLITVKEQLKLNKDLKVILMSATMDFNLLSKYFDYCPVINVPGQAFDVKIFHLEDILYRTGYRTALMDKYLRSMNDTNSVQYKLIPTYNDKLPSTKLPESTVNMTETCLQQGLDVVLDQCCLQHFRCEEELLSLFDQIQYFIESEGMSVDAAHSQTGITPLMAACKCNYLKYVEVFLLHKANVHLRDVQGFTALDYARMHADEICMQLLQSSCGISKNQLQLKQEIDDKQKILIAYQQQFNDENEVDHDLILSLLEGLYRSPHPGAIMVFLPGYNDIIQQRDLIQSTLPANTYRVCILHGQMNSQDQQEALQIHTVRKIILSTNIGQTSITIPDLAYIIDSGKVKLKTHDYITESSQLQTVWISKADACQRSGRAGRTQNGVCYRLYSTATYGYMSQFSIPEFMRIPLTEICLYAKTLDHESDVENYLSRALNPPSNLSVKNAIKKLQMLEVFNDDESVTELGRHLVDIPLDVQLGKCLLYGIFFKCFDSILTIVAFHSVKDPFILPTDRSTQGQASFQRKSFSGKTFSDQLGILELYKSYCSVRNNRKFVREFCNKYFLSQSAMEMFCATRRQISDLACQKFRIGQQTSLFNEDWNLVRYCLAAGFYPNVAVLDRQQGTILSGAGKQFILQRTSALNPPGMKNLKEFIDELPYDWIVFYEKSRVAQKCSLNMNTVVQPTIIAIQCGRHCVLDEEEENLDDSENSDDEEVTNSNTENAVLETKLSDGKTQQLMDKLESMSLKTANNSRKTIMCLDNWIKFEVPAGDANMILQLRTLIKSQFETFLQSRNSSHISTSVYHVQKLLYSSENIFP